MQGARNWKVTSPILNRAQRSSSNGSIFSPFTTTFGLKWSGVTFPSGRRRFRSSTEDCEMR